MSLDSFNDPWPGSKGSREGRNFAATNQPFPTHICAYEPQFANMSVNGLSGKINHIPGRKLLFSIHGKEIGKLCIVCLVDFAGYNVVGNNEFLIELFYYIVT